MSYKDKNIKIRNISLFVMSLCCFLFLTVLPLGHDVHFHIYRIGAMAEQLMLNDFQIPIRILSVSYNNYGYAVPLFYGDILLYIPAFFVCMGMNASLALRILLTSSFALCFGVMYFEVKRVSGKDELAYIMAMVYCFSPYFLIDLVIRMAVGEATAMIFIPMFFISLYGMVNRPLKNNWIHLSIGTTGLLLCHNLSAYFVVIVGTVYLAYHFWKIEDKKRILIDLAKSVGMCIGLSASFTLPLIEAMLYQKYQTPGNNGYQIANFPLSTLSIWDFFLPFEIKKIISSLFFSEMNASSWHPGGVGLPIILIVILCIILKKRKEEFTSIERNFFHAFILCDSIYCLMFIKPFVTWFGNYFAFSQFVWRLLSFCTYFWSFFLGALIYKLRKEKLGRMAFVTVALIGVYTFGTRYAYQIYLNINGLDLVAQNNAEALEEYDMTYNQNDGDNLYLPEGVKKDYYLTRGEVILREDGSELNSFHRDGTAIIINLDGKNEENLELPLYNYKGYKAYDLDTGEEIEVFPSDNKLVSIHVEKGHRNVEVKYYGTTIQTIGDYISMISLVGLAVIIGKAKRKEGRS